MGGITDLIGGKKSDGVSMQTHAAMKEAGVGPYETPPVPPPPPPSIKEQKSQVGSTTLDNERGLREALMKRGMSGSEADARIARNKTQKGYQ